jgi:hypothetical protein
LGVLLAAVKGLGGRERLLVSDAEFRAIAGELAPRLSARRSARSAPPDTTASGGRLTLDQVFGKPARCREASMPS